MDTFAALALATDPATPRSLDRKPDKLTAPLISVEMIKMIVAQATYQIIVCIVLHFAGYAILRETESTYNNTELGCVPPPPPHPFCMSIRNSYLRLIRRTLVFNCFVFMQIFNQLNCRRLDRRLNVLEGFFQNYWFILILAISKLAP